MQFTSGNLQATFEHFEHFMVALRRLPQLAQPLIDSLNVSILKVPFFLDRWASNHRRKNETMIINIKIKRLDSDRWPHPGITIVLCQFD